MAKGESIRKDEELEEGLLLHGRDVTTKGSKYETQLGFQFLDTTNVTGGLQMSSQDYFGEAAESVLTLKSRFLNTPFYNPLTQSSPFFNYKFSSWSTFQFRILSGISFNHQFLIFFPISHNYSQKCVDSCRPN